MSSPSRLLALTGVLLFLFCAAPIAGATYADPPGRVARLDDTHGDVSYSPAGENEWISVVRNRPLIRGDRLWTDRDARAEFQVGGSAIRLDSNTSVEILDLNDRIAQLQLTQGTLNLRVRHLYPGQSFEVDTPTLAFTISSAGRYRIDVDSGSAATTIVVWEGAGEANGENASFPLRAGDTVRFYDTDLRDYEMYGLPREDDFDRYSLDRDRRLDRSASLRYIDDDVVGYEDLDEYGSWRPVSSYGNVWFPSRVDADWAPYRDGHWVWQEPWGWTWVDDAPWGFAPSHYGRWVNVSNRWGWIPGPRNVRPVYAPALVAFVGGHGWSVSLSLGDSSPIGWFPLGPREVYVPSYQASRDYFKRVNVNNTVVNNTVINNVYNNYSSGNINIDHERYANRTVAGAVTAVPRTVFVNAQPVRRAAIRLDRNAITTGEVTRIAPVAPSVHSVIGAGRVVESRPSREAIDRQIFVRNAPPSERRPFAAREQQLQKNPGQAPEPVAGDSARSRGDNKQQNIHVISDQRDAVNARATGSRRGGGKSGTSTPMPSQLQPLDRSVEPTKASEPPTGDHSQGKEQKGQGDARQQAQRQRQADSEKNAADQQQVERQQKTDREQKAAADQRQAERQRQADTQQQAQRQRQADSEKNAADQQQVERQQKADREQKAAADQRQAERQRQADTQQQAQRQRQADSEKHAADQQQIERQRKTDREQKAAADQRQAERQRQADTQQQAQRQRQADSEKNAADQQQIERQQKTDREQKAAADQRQAERQRQADTQQQAQRQRQADSEKHAADQQQVERQQKADREQKAAADQRQAERQRQVDAQQQAQRQRKADSEKRAADQQQVERQQKADSEQKAAADQGQAERQRQVDAQQQAQRQHKADSKPQEQKQEAQRQAECEREAIRQHQDIRQCLPQQQRPDNQNADKHRR